MELYNHAPVAYLVLDESGVICDANLKAEELLSSNKSSLIGAKFERYIDDSSLDELNAHRESVLLSGDKQISELVLKAGTGQSNVVRMESKVIISCHSNRPYSQTILIDITAEKIAEATLKKTNEDLEQEVIRRTNEITISRDLLSSILNTATDAIITIDCRGLIENINPVTERMFGYTRTELIGSNISLLMPESEARLHNSYISRYVESEQSSVFGNPRDLIAVRQDGTRFPISLSVNKMDNAACFTGIIRDVSERVNLEKEVLSCIENERNRIGRDIHDSLGQHIVGLSMKARSIANRFKKDGDSACETFSDFSEDLEHVA
jgi:PAS domain S-box-containing protein